MGARKVNIGLDVGIASVGGAVVDVETQKIIKAGSRLFDEANTGNGSDQTAATRREHRSRRRNLRRKVTRKHDLINLYIKYGYLNTIDDFYQLDFNFDMLETRKFALENEIDIKILMMVLFNYIKH